MTNHHRDCAKTRYAARPTLAVGAWLLVAVLACGGSTVVGQGEGGAGASSTTSSVGGGSAGGTPSGGGGPCADVVATPPMAVAAGLAAHRPLIAARSDGAFGIAWEANGQLFTTILGTDGEFTLPPQPLGPGTWSDGAIASHEDEHVVLRYTTETIVERIDGAGQVISVPTSISSMHHVSAGSDGYLLTHNDGTGKLAHAFLGYDASAVGPSQLFPNGGSLDCCGGRRWNAHGSRSGGFVALWRSSSNSTGLDIVRFSADGTQVPGSHGFIDFTSAYPTHAATHGSGALFSSDEEVMLIGEDGALQGAASFALGIGSASSSGTAIRGAYGTSRGIDWYAIDLRGGEPTILLRMEPGLATTEPDQSTSPRVAFDGEGFGVVWLAPPSEVMFAYLIPCAE